MSGRPSRHCTTRSAGTSRIDTHQRYPDRSGATVKAWSRLGWAIVFGIVTFLWWQLLLNQSAAYLSAFEQTNVRVVLFTLGAFMLTTGGLWSYFRFRPEPAKAGG